MSLFTRRDFLRDSAALAAALAGTGALDRSLRADEQKTAAKKGDVNDQLRVAVVGVNGQGRAHVENCAGKNNCFVAVICDVDEAVIGRAMSTAEKGQGKAPRYEKDIRKVLDDKSIDLVSIATPNHWHALAAIWALQAGKDVYVEKPVSHNVREGRIIVETARKLKRICQTGTQSRSTTGMREAIAFLHSGKLGKVLVSRGLCYKSRKSIGKVSGPQEPPKTCAYDLWCGPAEVKPLMRQRLHYDWHWQWDCGNGDLGNQGIHEMDKARWGLQKNELPRSVISVGGRFGYVDDGETANTQLCIFDYGDAQLIFEVRGLPTDSPYPQVDKKGPNFVGNIFHCTNGLLICPDYQSGVAFAPDGTKLAEFRGGGYEQHFANFVKAVRSRKTEDLNADILEGHLSSALCHLGNISYRLGTLVPFDKKTQAFGDNKEAAETFVRMTEHLGGNKLPLDSTPYRLGRKLMIDPKTETFLNDRAADAMLTREYRKGFVVPDKV